MVLARSDTQRRRPVLLLLIVTSIVLITIDSRGSGVVGTIRSVARDVIAPVQDLVDDAFSPVRDAISGITDFGSLKEENARLRRELADAEGKLLRERAVGSEVGELEKLLDLPTIEDATGIAVRVVGGSPGNFERTVQINKGRSSGIEVGLPVVAGEGLVGKVTETSSSRATVTLIDSPDFGIGVRLEQSPGVQGIAEGRTGSREMRLTFLQNIQATITVGELVFTSAVAGSAFPPDLAVARVHEVGKLKGNLEPTVTLRPLVDLDDLTYLKVLRTAVRGSSQSSSGQS